MQYSSLEGGGVTIVVVAASLSLLCVVGLLGFLVVLLLKGQHHEQFFVRTHTAAYFMCLLMGDMIQSIASVMNIKWVIARGVSLDSFCTAQGAIKNAGNIAISVWTLMLAIHIFSVLFLRIHFKDWVLYVSLIAVWFLVGFVVIIGPAAIQRVDKGPYFGIAGYWCWISDPYPLARIGLEYLWMFASAGISFVLYTLTFLRLRGNIVIENGKIFFVRVQSIDAWKYEVAQNANDVQMTAIAKSMIGFPVLFFVLILPIAICRFVAWSGKFVPFEAVIFSDTVFSLTGVFNLILFIITRSLFLRDPTHPSDLKVKLSDEVKEYNVQPYYVQDFVSAHGFNDIYRSQAESELGTPRPRASTSLSLTVQPSRPPRPQSLGELPIDDSHTEQDLEWDNVELEASASERSSTPAQGEFDLSSVMEAMFSPSTYESEFEDSSSSLEVMSPGMGTDFGGRHDDSDERDG